MCGIAGAFYFDSPPQELWSDQLQQRILHSIEHRGPDSNGVHIDVVAGLIMLHSRLAVRDLTSSGHQPMKSGNQRHVLSYNGEIYGDGLKVYFSQNLWQELSQFSDTRVLIEALSRGKTRDVLSSANGMFAIAIYDSVEEKLTLARDRFGEKPLYYHSNNRRVIYASELGALMEFGDFDAEIDRASCAAFMRHNYVPSNKTILKGVYKLPPGSYMEFSRKREIQLYSYFVAKEEFVENNFKNSQTEQEELESVLRNAVRERLVSDVPIGCLLSGGIDSSLVAAYMQDENRESINTFSIGFEHSSFDEAPFARRVAERLGTNHHELYVNERDALEIVPQLSSIYSEPFADSSQIPTVLISRFARSQVPVVLTGDGGDEMFAGYTRYSRLLEIDSLKLDGLVKIFSSGKMQSLLKVALKATPEILLEKFFGIKDAHSKSERYFQSYFINPSIDIYRTMVSHWPNPTEIINTDTEYIHSAWSKEFSKGVKSRLDLMRLIDICTYLPDDILVKVDRASMSVGLETRAPFLDPNVFSFATQLSNESLIDKGELKAPLKALAYKLIGKDIMERRKMGFGVPLSSWLRGPLRGWAEDLIRQENKGELFNEPLLRTYWDRHLAGEDWGYWIWNYLMLKDWLLRQSKISI